MKIKAPLSRFHLDIKKKDCVLEVGGGHNPHPRSNVVVDKYVDDNTHRADNLKVLKNQQFIHADGENLPFKDKEFDYAICCHVLEHVPYPEKFIGEQTRVASRGYIETPSLLGCYLSPKKSHKWVLLDIDDKIVMYDKALIGFDPPLDLSFLFLRYLPSHAMGFKILQRTHPEIMTMNYEWKDNIELLVNPKDDYYLKFFKEPWQKDFCDKFITNRSLGSEAKATVSALADIMKSVWKSKVLKK
jgi:methyltransferase family protein